MFNHLWDSAVFICWLYHCGRDTSIHKLGIGIGNIGTGISICFLYIDYISIGKISSKMYGYWLKYQLTARYRLIENISIGKNIGLDNIYRYGLNPFGPTLVCTNLVGTGVMVLAAQCHGYRNYGSIMVSGTMSWLS